MKEYQITLRHDTNSPAANIGIAASGAGR